MSKGYINFLRALLFNKIYNSQTINLISGTLKTASRYRTRGVNNGHIRKIEYSHRERTAHKVTLYALTKRGFRFLIENDPILPEWLGDDAADRFDVLSAADRQEKNRLRIARDTACLTIAQNAGAYVPMENYTTWMKAKLETDEPEESQSIPVGHVIAMSLEKGLYDELFDQSSARPTIQFHFAME